MAKENDTMFFDIPLWFGDVAVNQLRHGTRSIWLNAFLRMHQLDRRGKLTGTVDDLSRTCCCTSGEMLAAISDLIFRDATDITTVEGTPVIREPSGRLSADGKPINGNSEVTLVNRKMSREWKDRVSSRDRKRTHDSKLASNGEVTEEVTPKVTGKVTKKPPGAPYYSPPLRDSSSIPENLRTEEFFCAWESFVNHRKEKKKLLTETSVEMLLKKLARWGPDRAVAAIVWSIENGWQGVFENDSQKKNGATGESKTERSKREFEAAIDAAARAMEAK